MEFTLDLPLKAKMPKNLLIRYTPSDHKQLFINMSINIDNVKYTLTSVILADSIHATATSIRSNKYFHFNDSYCYCYDPPLIGSYFLIPNNLKPLGFSYTLESPYDQATLTSSQVSTAMKRLGTEFQADNYSPMKKLYTHQMSDYIGHLVPVTRQ